MVVLFTPMSTSLIFFAARQYHLLVEILRVNGYLLPVRSPT